MKQHAGSKKATWIQQPWSVELGMSFKCSNCGAEKSQGPYREYLWLTPWCPCCGYTMSNPMDISADPESYLRYL